MGKKIISTVHRRRRQIGKRRRTISRTCVDVVPLEDPILSLMQGTSLQDIIQDPKACELRRPVLIMQIWNAIRRTVMRDMRTMESGTMGLPACRGTTAGLYGRSGHQVKGMMVESVQGAASQGMKTGVGDHTRSLATSTKTARDAIIVVQVTHLTAAGTGGRSIGPWTASTISHHEGLDMGKSILNPTGGHLKDQTASTAMDGHTESPLSPMVSTSSPAAKTAMTFSIP